MAEQLTFDLAYTAGDAAGDFFVSAANRTAVDWLRRYPDWNAPGLVLYGPAGVGKSHLARAWATQNAAMDITDAAAIGDYLAADCLQPVVIDNAAAFCADARRAEQMFFLYQRLQASSARLLLLDERPAQQWDIPLADLASRLRALPQVEIEAPDDELVSALLLKYFTVRGITPDAGIIDFLLPRVPRSAPEILSLIATLDAETLKNGRKMTLAAVKDYYKND